MSKHRNSAGATARSDCVPHRTNQCSRSRLHRRNKQRAGKKCGRWADSALLKPLTEFFQSPDHAEPCGILVPTERLADVAETPFLKKTKQDGVPVLHGKRSQSLVDER